MLRNEIAQLKDMPKGYEAVGETHRKTKAPVHFSAPSSAAAPAKKEVVIVKGKGEKLSAIPYVADQISSRKSTDKALSTLHHLAFGVPPKHLTVKKYLREFSGVVYGADNNRARLEARLESRAVPLLRDLCTLLGVHGGSRADMIKNVADFLEKPTVTDAKVKKGSKAKSSKKTAKKGDKKIAEVLAENGDEAGCFMVVKAVINSQDSFVVFWAKTKVDNMVGRYPDAYTWDEWKDHGGNGLSIDSYKSPNQLGRSGESFS